MACTVIYKEDDKIIYKKNRKKKIINSALNWIFIKFPEEKTQHKCLLGKI